MGVFVFWFFVSCKSLIVYIVMRQLAMPQKGKKSVCSFSLAGVSKSSFHTFDRVYFILHLSRDVEVVDIHVPGVLPLASMAERLSDFICILRDAKLLVSKQLTNKLHRVTFPDSVSYFTVYCLTCKEKYWHRMD